MRLAHKDMQRFYYCQNLGVYLKNARIINISADDEQYIVDQYGNMTGELLTEYSRPAELMANISPATGNSQADTFGQLDNYDKVIVTSWMDCPINEQTVLFIDMTPEFDVFDVDVLNNDVAVEGEEPPPVSKTITVTIPRYNYVVRRVAKSLNYIAYAVQKVR